MGFMIGGAGGFGAGRVAELVGVSIPLCGSMAKCCQAQNWERIIVFLDVRQFISRRTEREINNRIVH